MTFHKSSISTAVLLAVMALPSAGQAPRKPRLAQLDQSTINFIRPGVKVKIVSAAIAQDGTITARVNVTDPKGVPLDKDGIVTPGPINLRFIAAYIPGGQKEYVAYTTTLAKATLNNNPSQTQAATDSGGTFTSNAVGDYTYKFTTKAPSNFDATVTHSIGVSAQRNLSEFGAYAEWSQTSNDVFNFVPDGSAVKVTRQVAATQTCNNCHDPIVGHGGSRLTVEMCILCHTPQTINPDTQLTQDMPVLIHKIHMGKNLPSVQAGTPYRIWHRSRWSDFSDVGFPSGTDELKTCTVCHQNAPQTTNYLSAPNRAACGACHDNVDFATGKNHQGIAQVTDSNCATCHVPQGELEFDNSIQGAHTVTTRSTQLPGIVFSIVRVDNAKTGQKPAVTFTVKNKAGNTVDIATMDFLNLVMAGPTTDYGPYVSEDARKATVGGGQYTYTFNAALPATAAGSYVVGIEGFKSVTINPSTDKQVVVRDVGFNQVLYFAIGGGKAAPRRLVISQATCSNCHNRIALHGGIRQNVEYCVVCHSPTQTDSAMRKTGDTAESINFKTMIHKIHTGAELTTPFTVMGHGNVAHPYNDVGYPGDRQDCTQCHLPGTFNLPLSDGQISQVAPRDYLTTMAPTTAACLSCHTTEAAASHASLMTSPKFGESCEACHGPNSEASVAKVHARQ